ncbi:MAG TPA: SEC-C metal-binding domain-containing protein, partial [Candidatus Dojkabacteria bacterium]
QFTGRVLPGRRYSEGLHQAIEAKEKVEIKKESKTLATITFQNFFRLYKILDGASGTIMTEAEEFYKIYKLDSVQVPTNKPVIRKDQTDRVFKNKVAKFNAVKNEIIEANKTGRPILVGTTSIEDSETVSKLLDKEGIKHNVLNAKFHEKESRIVADAGKKGAVTVATNMAGRGTDIKLGGQNATDEEYKEVMDLGGLYVIGTERHEARRVDNQLRGRSGRQGEPGETRFFVALDDQIMRIQGGNIVQRLMTMTNIPEDTPIESGMIGNSIERAQKKMEGHNFDIRKRLVEYDDVMNQQREIFYTRRMKALEVSENAKGKFWRGRDVILEEDDSKKEEARKKIEVDMREYLDSEVEGVVSEHFFADRDDKNDLSKTIDGILDLAQDQHIAKAASSAGERIKLDELHKYFEEKLKGKEMQEVSNYFRTVVSKVADFKFKEYEKDLPDVAKGVILQAMDQLWTDHVEAMRDLREGIGLRGYAQRDPLVEYKNEAFIQFETFIKSINSQISKRVLKMVKVQQTSEPPSAVIETNADQIEDVLTGTREILDSAKKSADETLKNISKPQVQKVKKVIALDGDKFKNVGRNDPCPCGSGKKFKKCHGKAR